MPQPRRLLVLNKVSLGAGSWDWGGADAQWGLRIMGVRHCEGKAGSQRRKVWWTFRGHETNICGVCEELRYQNQCIRL